MRESSSWCLLCLEILNNSAPSYCSCLNRSFPLIPPELKATTHPSMGVCMCSDSVRLCVVLHLVFCLTCCAILRELLVSGLRLFFFFFFLSIFLSFIFFLAEPVFSSSRCQVEASAGAAGAAGAGLCEELLFDVPSVARSHKVEGKQCTTALAWICSSS